MAKWSSTGQDASQVEVEKELTELEILESLQAGDWLQFCPSIYDHDTDYVKVVAVNHTDEMIAFDYIYIGCEAGEEPATFDEHRKFISNSGKIDDMIIRKVDLQELVDFINSQINNVAAELWQYLGEKK